MSAPGSTHCPGFSDPLHVSNAPATPDHTQANAAPSHLLMQEDMRRSRSSERQSSKSSAQKSAESQTVDERKSLLTAGANITKAYLPCRLSELRARKIKMEMLILDQQKTMIDSLLKDLADFKIQVQKDEHLGNASQYILEECSAFQRELQQSLLTKEQEYDMAIKKQKISDPRETKSAPSRDQDVYPRSGQAASVKPVTSLEAHGHELPAKDDQSSINMLLIGNCGNGKSATGNSILGKPAFRTSSSSSVASASSIKMDSTDVAGKVVNVIDGPSINISGNMTPEEVENIIEKVKQSLELCNYSFTALVIILKFGIRYTKQEIEALRVIKTLLGKDVIREHGMCVITHGDGFDYSLEEEEFGEGMTFDSWLKEQTGDVATLFEECNFRCVLFDNVSKDVTKRQVQLDKLMKSLPKGKRYSKDAYSQARQGTEELEMEASLPSFLKAAQAEADTIKELLDQHEEIKKYDPEASNIKLKLSELKKKVDKMRVSSGELENLKMSLRLLESNLQTKLTKWQIEREFRMKMGAQGTTSDRSSIPSLADQTKMEIDDTPYDRFDSTGFQQDVNRCVSATSNYNTDMSAPSNYNTDMYAPLEFATSKNQTSSSVDTGSHAVSNTVPIQSWSLNYNPTTATRQMYANGISYQHSGTAVNIQGYVVVDKEMVSGEGNAPPAINKKSGKDVYKY